MMVGLYWYFDPSSPHRPKKSCQSWTPLAKFSGFAHVQHLHLGNKDWSDQMDAQDDDRKRTYDFVGLFCHKEAK